MHKYSSSVATVTNTRKACNSLFWHYSSAKSSISENICEIVEYIVLDIFSHGCIGLWLVSGKETLIRFSSHYRQLSTPLISICFAFHKDATGQSFCLIISMKKSFFKTIMISEDGIPNDDTTITHQRPARYLHVCLFKTQEIQFRLLLR